MFTAVNGNNILNGSFSSTTSNVADFNFLKSDNWLNFSSHSQTSNQFSLNNSNQYLYTFAIQVVQQSQLKHQLNPTTVVLILNQRQLKRHPSLVEIFLEIFQEVKGIHLAQNLIQGLKQSMKCAEKTWSKKLILKN